MTRPRTATLGSYSDIRTILDAVLARGDCVLTLDTPGQAINMRQRCYRYRALLQKKMEADQAPLIAAGKLSPGALPETPYDNILIQIDNDPTRLLFSRRDTTKLLSRLSTAEGAPVEPVGETELERQARNFARSLDLD